MEEFIRQLLQDKGVPADVEPEVKEQLVRDLTSRVTDMVNRRMIDSLNDTDLAEFEKMIDENPDDVLSLQHFIEQHVPEKEALTAAALLRIPSPLSRTKRVTRIHSGRYYRPTSSTD